mmetsp:Transcript_24056/g.79963  ORF Transcript_24056/g.79963 Transcript_24056/m.79963 type:complete len:341 (+) Transcript_24056:180-1202(+)
MRPSGFSSRHPPVSGRHRLSCTPPHYLDARDASSTRRVRAAAGGRAPLTSSARRCAQSPPRGEGGRRGGGRRRRGRRLSVEWRHANQPGGCDQADAQGVPWRQGREAQAAASAACVALARRDRGLPHRQGPAARRQGRVRGRGRDGKGDRHRQAAEEVCSVRGEAATARGVRLLRRRRSRHPPPPQAPRQRLLQVEQAAAADATRAQGGATRRAAAGGRRRNRATNLWHLLHRHRRRDVDVARRRGRECARRRRCGCRAAAGQVGQRPGAALALPQLGGPPDLQLAPHAVKRAPLEEKGGGARAEAGAAAGGTCLDSGRWVAQTRGAANSGGKERRESAL